MEEKEKYVVITYCATGNCWMNYFYCFDTQEEAIEYSRGKEGVIIKTGFFHQFNLDK